MAGMTPYYLHSIRSNTYLTWVRVVCELVDNSFDAGADHVTLSWPGGKVFEISDDGIGVDDLDTLMTFGGRKDHASTDIGKYGVGCKQAMVWLWGRSEVETHNAKTSSRIEVNWDDAADLDSWDSFPKQFAIDRTGKRGTHIKSYGIRSYPSVDAMVESLSSTYAPGLLLGKRITTQWPKTTRVIKPRQLPPFEKCIDDTIMVAGRSVHITMGIVKEGVVNPFRHGFCFERTYRVIKETTLGAKDFSVARIAARIKLGPEWSLSTNKDDFLDFRDELEDAIYECCHPLMQEGSQQAVTMEDDMFNRELADLITQASRRGKRAARDPNGGKIGSIPPKNTGRKTTNASKTSDKDGNIPEVTDGPKRRTGVHVEWTEMQDQCVGRYDSDGNRIWMNSSNEFMARMRRNRNVDALAIIALAIASEHAVTCANGQHPLFHNPLDDFLTQWGSVIAPIDAEKLIGAMS